MWLLRTHSSKCIASALFTSALFHPHATWLRSHECPALLSTLQGWAPRCRVGKGRSRLTPGGLPLGFSPRQANATCRSPSPLPRLLSLLLSLRVGGFCSDSRPGRRPSPALLFDIRLPLWNAGYRKAGPCPCGSSVSPGPSLPGAPFTGGIKCMNEWKNNLTFVPQASFPECLAPGRELTQLS